MCPIAQLILAAAILVPVATPALAQTDPDNDKVNAVIVYGDDKCPEPTGNEITVCARKAEKERYRIPQGLRETPSAKSEAWNNKVIAYETVGRTGTLSCTPVGPGGWTGCSQKLIDQAYAEKKAGVDVQFAKIIEEERARRMATVDADAAKAQAQVESAEKDYDQRQRATEDAAEAAKTPAAPPPTGK